MRWRGAWVVESGVDAMPKSVLHLSILQPCLRNFLNAIGDPAKHPTVQVKLSMPVSYFEHV